MNEENKLYPYQIFTLEDLPNEQWKDIEGFPNYQVSSLGRIKSLNYNQTSKPKIRKQTFKNKESGYLQIVLWNCGKHKAFKIHRLVAKTFIPNPNNHPQINHKDENKVNNTVENLEFCTSKYNMNYGTRNQRISKALSIPIIQIDENNTGKKWESSMQAEREGDFDNRAINKCCKGKSKIHKGFKFDYFTPPAIYKG